MDEFREVTKMIMSEIDKDINVPNKNDTISRRAAAGIVRFECGEWRGLAKTIIDKLDALPSAQPSPCDVCRYAPPSSMDGKPCAVCPAERCDHHDYNH